MLSRAARPEAIVDLARLAGLAPAGVLCDVMKADGTLARLLDRIVRRETDPYTAVEEVLRKLGL